ncbi:MAG TPA: phospholipase A, partial [Opitutus sp.]|nr:phospholipase A [Opitutus sp.]
ASSSPFYDTSYLPEIAISTDASHPGGSASWFTWMGWRAGYQHESNGRDDADSRSLNRVYLRPRFILGSLDAWAFVMLPEIHAYIGGVEDNSGIKDYRGYGSLRFYFGRNGGPALMVTGWTGRDFDHASYQLDLTVPVRLRRLNVESFLLVQYFNGYGESLRSYDLKTDALRVGFGLVR